jgi:hypothetical protein
VNHCTSQTGRPTRIVAATLTGLVLAATAAAPAVAKSPAPMTPPPPCGPLLSAPPIPLPAGVPAAANLRQLAATTRDLVWSERFGTGFDQALIRDVDVAFFDPADLSRACDDAVTTRLGNRLPDVPWEAKNQAAVHFPVKSLCSIA